ncbi:MAG: hypothetical protein SPJ59_07390 [Peptoniphilaceae bacterium]|nr:hypothetical protein [Peptoniphilaceae bacterium]
MNTEKRKNNNNINQKAQQVHGKTWRFLAIIIAPWLIFTVILIFRTEGQLLIGRTAFILLLISRICMALAALEIALFLLMIIQPFLLRLLALAGVILAIFSALYHPAADLLYLSHPIQADIEVTSLSWDMQYAQYSSFYHMYGTDKNGQELSFRVNRSTYYHLRKTRDLRLHAVYLPHTKHLLEIRRL